MDKRKGVIPELPREDIWSNLSDLTNHSSQNEPLPFNEYSQQFREAVDRFARFYSKSSTHDKYEAAYYNAFGQLLNEDTIFDPILDDMRVTEVGGSFKHPHEAAYSLNKVVQLVLKEESQVFPINYETVDQWKPNLCRLANDVSFHSELMKYFRLPIMSNVSERGKLLKAALVMNERDTGEGLEIGCSLKHIFKRLALLDTTSQKDQSFIGYEPVHVLGAVPDSAVRARRDQGKSLALNKLIRETDFKLGRSVCLDIMDTDRDLEMAKWAASNSFYMGELLKYKQRLLFDILLELAPLDVDLEFVWQNAATWEPAEMKRPMDFVYIATTLYESQDKPEEVSAILSRAERALKADGLLIVQDFVDIDENEELHFDRKRGPWSYKVWVKDMAKPELGYQHYFTAESGRVRRLVLGQGLGHLALARQLELAPAA